MSSTAIVRVPTASSSARSWEISSTAPSKPWSAASSASRRLEVEVVGRLVEDQDVGAGVHEDRQRQPPALAARETLDRLLGRLAGEQELAEQRARLRRGELRGALGGLEHGGGRVELLGVLGEQAELDVVAAPQLAGVELALAGERRDQRRLARPVGPDQRHVLAALQPQLGVAQQLALADPQRRVLHLEHDPAGALGRLEREAERLAVARVAGDALHLVELLRARLRLARAGAGAEAGHEALEPLDLLLLALDRAAERELARRLLLAPGVPRALEELRAAGLELEHRRCRPPPGTSGRGRRARRRRRASAGAPRATRATRCRGGWWARRAAAGRGRRPARARARRASARRRRTSRASGRGRSSRKPRPCSVALMPSRQP